MGNTRPLFPGLDSSHFLNLLKSCKILGLIFHHFHCSSNPHTIIKLYSSLVHPILEHCSPVCMVYTLFPLTLSQARISTELCNKDSLQFPSYFLLLQPHLSLLLKGPGTSSGSFLITTPFSTSCSQTLPSSRTYPIQSFHFKNYTPLYCCTKESLSPSHNLPSLLHHSTYEIPLCMPSTITAYHHHLIIALTIT